MHKFNLQNEAVPRFYVCVKLFFTTFDVIVLIALVFAWQQLYLTICHQIWWSQNYQTSSFMLKFIPVFFPCIILLYIWF